MREATPEPIEAPSEQTSAPMLACMGTTACQRVCKFVTSEHAASAADDNYALPLEQTCSVLDTITAQENPMAVSELLSSVRLPELGALKGDELVEEATGLLTNIEQENAAFNSYLQSVLRGTSQPRFVLSAAEQTYKEARVFDSKYSPSTDKDKEELLAFHGILRGFYDRHTLAETGLLFDSAMQEMFIAAAREIGVGHNVKLVGEPGIAKTAFAKYLAFQNAKVHHPDRDEAELVPTLISFSSTSEAEDKMSEPTFQEGTLGKQLGEIGEAMRDGRGVILDEQNGLSAEQQVFFNDYFLKKPGQSVTINNETFEIAKGFCVIATLNSMTDTQGKRRHGRQQQDSASSARFTRLDFKHPYQQGYAGNSEETISRIFFAHYVDSFGWQMPNTTMVNLLNDTLELTRELTRKATEPTQDGTTTSITAAQAQPDLAEWISARDLGRILESGFGYKDSESSALIVRKLIYDRVQQILESDNGHFVTQKAKDAVDVLLKNWR